MSVLAMLAAMQSSSTTASDLEEIVVRGARSASSFQELDPTASGLVIELQRRVQTGEVLADVLPEVPGANVMRTGGYGSLTSVAIRGGDSRHTTVFLGNVPLNGPDTGGYDLSLVPLDAYQRVEVYRGGAPLWFNDSAIGGVVRLVPRTARSTSVSTEVEGGSFGTWSADATGSFAAPSWNVFLSGGGLRTENNFSYADDGGTTFTDEDDVLRERQNAHVMDGHGFLHAQLFDERQELSLIAFGLFREQGEPGPASAPALQAERRTARGFASIAYQAEDTVWTMPARLLALSSFGLNQDAFRDELAEIGIGRHDADDRAITGQGRIALSLEPWSWLEATAVFSARHDRYNPEDAFVTVSQQPSYRSRGSEGLEARFHFELGPVATELRPSIRFEQSRAAILTPPSDSVAGAGEPELRSRSTSGTTYRFGALVAPQPWLNVVGSASSGSRLPSILELFGDRALLVANPRLIAERSRSVEGGVTLTPCWDVGCLNFEARVFRLWVHDLIRFRKTSQFTSIAQNIDSGNIFGAELGLHTELFRHAAISASMTLSRTRDGDSSRSLPMRPDRLIYARVEGKAGRIIKSWLDDARVFVDVEHRSAHFLDPANLIEKPARTWIGAGVRLYSADERVSLAATMHDLFDAGGADLLGFPIPGRRFTVSLSFKDELP
jgi:outer membrane cobalamin receptor